MSTMAKPLSISRILIGDPYVLLQDEVLIPVRRVRVLAENGAMFSRVFLAFGLDKDRVRKAWETEPEKFLKVELNPQQKTTA
jgi:hypothetical protein